MTEVITKELLETSIAEHEDFVAMVTKNKYGHEDIKDVIEGVIDCCNITDKDQKELLRSGKFIPAGSILSACNSGATSSFSNCYYVPIRHDSIEGIYEAHKQIARTFSYRGGVGTDISILRPKGHSVENAARTSSGAVSFMPSFSELTKTICQFGRRGALLISLDCRHPDTLDFIWSKAKPEKVFEEDVFTKELPAINNANITLKLTDSFMTAVENDEDWTFCFPDIEADKELYNSCWDGDYDEWFEIGGKFKEYKTIKARDVLSQLSEAAWICGDPGTSYITTVQKNTFGTYIDKSLKPFGYNACSEQPMAGDSNCLLGAFVLPFYLLHGRLDIVSLEEDAEVATRLMNLFSDMNEDLHPLAEQRSVDKFGKRIGVELTGFGDLCQKLGFTYGDEDSIDLANDITDSIMYSQLVASNDLAVQGKCCEAMSSTAARNNFVDNPWYKIEGALKENILDYGLANTSLNTIGPCGSISIVSGNCSSGIEPIFKFSYKRKNRIDNKEYSFIHLPAAQHMLDNLDEFKGLTLEQAKNKMGYVEANEIHWKDRINVQAALQKNIDASISSTINLSNDTKKETIQEIYKYAWSKGLKGVTVFRDGCKEGVLSSTDTEEVAECVMPELYEKELLDEETAVRHRVSWKGSKIYINVSIDQEGNPIEVFVKLPKEGGHNGDGTFNPVLFQERNSLWDSLCRVCSMSLRYGIPVEEIIDQLNKSTYSMVDAAGILKRILSKYLPIEDPEVSVGKICPECGLASYVNEGGCLICKECGFSKCG